MAFRVVPLVELVRGEVVTALGAMMCLVVGPGRFGRDNSKVKGSIGGVRVRVNI